MVQDIFKLVAFLLLGLVYFYSLAGFGRILSNKNSNIFELQLDGTIVLLIIGYFIYLTIGFNPFINVLILSIGLFFVFKKKIEIISSQKYVIFLFISLFSILIISKTHEDFNNYHLFSIFEVFNNSLRIGVSKINTYWIHSSLLKFNQSLIVLPIISFSAIHLPIFIIYLSTIGYFLLIIFTKETKRDQLFYSLFCVIILLVKFNRLSEFGYDYISQFILLIVFHKIYFLNNDNHEISKSILYYILCVLIKPISLLFSPILFFIFFKNGLGFFKKISISKYFIYIMMSLIFFSSSFIKTGCIFYPINSTCFPKEKVFWSEKAYLKSYSQTVELWSKSYDAQKKISKYKKIEDTNVYLENFNWVKFWIEKHFFYKVFEFLLLTILIISIIYFLLPKTVFEGNKDKKEKYVILLLSFLSIFFWFNTVPQFRFGFSFIMIFVFYLFNLLLNLKIKFNKKRFIYLIFLALLFLNIKNLIRIKNEFLRDDFYKFTNFPYFNQKVIKYDYSNLKRDNFFYIELLK